MAKSKIKIDLKKIFKKKQPKAALEYILEHGTLAQMQATKVWVNNLIDYHWQYYSELAHQRAQNFDKIREVLLSCCISEVPFEGWQRGVKYQYSLHPLSSAGSIKFAGQRFNYGNDINTNIAPFHSLYIAIDKDTVLQETLGQVEVANSKLSAQEIALTNKESETIVSVSGKLDKVIDLSKASSLKKLVSILKNFKLSKNLKNLAKSLQQVEPFVIKTEKELLATLLEKNWRNSPVNLDIPSNSQIFGHLVYSSGIDAIAYPSKMTNKQCIALFAKNFQNGDSYIKLDHKAPHEIVPTKIDGNSWRLSEMSFEELLVFPNIH